MKNKYYFISLLLLSFMSSFGQLVPREVLKGQIISDSLSNENVTVFNISTNKGAVSDALGYFTLYARQKDTLVFSSVVFKSKMLILAENDFKVIVLKVKLDQYINELDEVIVTPTTLTGDLEKDARNIKVTAIDSKIDNTEAVDRLMTPDEYNSAKNTAMLPDGSMMYAMDFVKIGKMVGKWFGVNKEKKDKYVFTSDKIFQEAVKDKFTYHFFTTTLGLKDNEIGLFLAYCDGDVEVKKLLQADKEIDLIDYLINKSTEFKKLPKDE